ncbi:potassium channel family protein [Hydrogenovibrio sp. JE_KL2]|uniref:potassium channel family protein n=1 Tax=Hydrogenovibrio sp. JE_KL2 TaxID=2651188 RepID=UPI00128ADE41|nr:potassium channel family protein [Hydrogenovibrio sp. JE_KL2]MPQ75637.1 Ion transport protein [Hydrogenovibrio sp. JE_KL2]
MKDDGFTPSGQLKESVQEKIKQVNLRAILGVEGVHSEESQLAINIGRIFSVVVVLALMVVLVQLLLGLAHEKEGDFYVTVGVWAVFAAELSVNLILVKNKKRYLLHNWLNVTIVVFAFPWLNYGSEWTTILRTLRFMLLIRVVADIFWDVVLILRRNNFWMVLLAETLLIIVSGAIFAALENRDFSTGIWYSLVTITTVGYGDVVPYTEKGRIFGTILIVFGVIFFSLITANIAAFLVGAEQRRTEKEILDYVKITKLRLEEQSEVHERRMNHILTQLTEKLDSIESEIDEKQHAQRLSKRVSDFEDKLKNDSKHFQHRLDEIEKHINRRANELE